MKYLITLLIVVGLVAAGWYYTRPQPVAVTLYTVEKGRVEKTVSNTRVGTVKACRRSYLAPTIAGKVASLSVKEGDHVKAGQVLLEIWNEDLKAQLKLEQTKKISAMAQSREACSRAAGAEREYKRLTGMQKKKLVSDESVDNAATEAESRQAACQAANANVQVSEAQIAVTKSTLERTEIRAPYDGVVAEVNAELGEYVTPSPQGIPTLPAIDLLDLSCLYVSAPIDEVDAPPIRVGMNACVQLDAYSNRICNGTVRRIAPYVLDVEKQARTVEVEVALNKPDEFPGLLPGYSADIEIRLDARDNVLRIPTESVLEGDRVLFYDAATGMIDERSIKTGLSNWNYTEVVSGLKEGDRIVLSVGREGVKAGIQVTPETPASVDTHP